MTGETGEAPEIGEGMSNDSDWQLTDGFNIALLISWVVMLISLIVGGVYNEAPAVIAAWSVLWMVFIITTDVFLAIKEPPRDTWSEQLRDWSLKYTTVPPWIFGVMCGRWFHPFNGPLMPDWAGYLGIGLSSAVVLILGIVFWKTDNMKWAPPWLVCLLAIVAGACFVPAQFPAP